MLPPLQSRGDAAIRETDNDAAAARLSAVKKGYLNDPYIKYFVPRGHLLSPRPPLINIGTYVRTTALDALVYQWLQISDAAGQKSQIVSLGAGSDTRYWRLAVESSAGPLNEHLATYIELDLPENTMKKAMTIKKNKELMIGLGDSNQISLGQGGMALHSARYHLLPVDLRKDPSEILEPLVDQNRLGILDPSLPTLLIFECVLVYMAPESSSRLLSWFVDKSCKSTLGCIVYEMFGLNDSFGRVMIDNLKERGITLPGAVPHPTIESLSERFLKTGFSAARATTLKDIRRAYIEPEELERIAALEFLDETEELDLVLAHYAISWGWFVGTSDQSKDWGHWGLSQTEGQRLKI